MVNADGTGLTPLTSDTHPDQDPAWFSPPRAPSPTVAPSTAPAETRCVTAQTPGDFDGDGVPDQAEFVVIDWDDVSCADGEAVAQNFQSQELVVRFASGRTLDGPFPTEECSGGSCAYVFEATDLDGDGRDELAIDVGPGAVIGGGFDAIDASPVDCRVNADGTRELVAIHAESRSGPITGLWDVHRAVMVLQGDRLVVTSTSDTKETRSAFGGPLFRNGCP